jgi:hypothetical protein
MNDQCSLLSLLDRHLNTNFIFVGKSRRPIKHKEEVAVTGLVEAEWPCECAQRRMSATVRYPRQGDDSRPVQIAGMSNLT